LFRKEIFSYILYLQRCFKVNKSLYTIYTRTRNKKYGQNILLKRVTEVQFHGKLPFL